MVLEIATVDTNLSSRLPFALQRPQQTVSRRPKTQEAFFKNYILRTNPTPKNLFANEEDPHFLNTKTTRTHKGMLFVGFVCNKKTSIQSMAPLEVLVDSFYFLSQRKNTKFSSSFGFFLPVLCVFPGFSRVFLWFSKEFRVFS